MSEEPSEEPRRPQPGDEPVSGRLDEEKGTGWTRSFAELTGSAEPRVSPSQPVPLSSSRPAPPVHQPSQPPAAPPGPGRPVPPAQPPAGPARPARPAPPDPQLTSVLATPTPPTQSVIPPARPPEQSLELPDPGTESVLPDSTSGSVPGTGTGSGSGAFPGTSRRTGRRTSRRGRLGAGLVEVPPVPYLDPASAVLANPMVSVEKRFCGQCSAKVGRGDTGPEGVCEKCGTLYSFVPKLQRTDLLGGQYEVLGAIAYGGLGWIYLAQDLNVNNRWVVLKGLIDTGDANALAAAVNETRFLAEVEHPNIVKIYNFVQHPDPKTGHSVGYIVMEYVGGQSLRQTALAHHRKLGRPDPLPIGQVIAYGLEILPALGYLHSQNLLYCDLKPDNVIQTREQLKLIDMGAVRHTDDYNSPLFFTTGYAAPELARQGASVASDLYTVGRTLAVLSFEFNGYTTKYKEKLPTPDEVPLFKLFGSYYRFLKRATHPDPDRRFIAAEDMHDQLSGVLREIIALGTGKPRPGASTVFGPESNTFGIDLVVPETRGESGNGSPKAPVPVPDGAEVVRGLPIPQVDTGDPGAGVLTTTTVLDPRGAIDALVSAPRQSIEVRLRIVRARIELGELAEASRQLQAAQYLAIRAGYPHDWRIDWHRGLIELAGGRQRVAQMAFEAVYDDLPGEIAPKLALAVSAEGVGDYFAASRLYELVWRTDRSYVSAAFGLARVYLVQGARSSAIEVLESVPSSSTHYTAAQVATIKIRATATDTANGAVSDRDLADAGARLERLALDAERRLRLSIEILESAFTWVGSAPPGYRAVGTVLGCALAERDLRFGLERSYRALARLAGTAADRIALVDRANAIRPRTLT